jgi:hypothetical protein
VASPSVCTILGCLFVCNIVKLSACGEPDRLLTMYNMDYNKERECSVRNTVLCECDRHAGVTGAPGEGGDFWLQPGLERSGPVDGDWPGADIADDVPRLQHTPFLPPRGAAFSLEAERGMSGFAELGRGGTYKSSPCSSASDAVACTHERPVCSALRLAGTGDATAGSC